MKKNLLATLLVFTTVFHGAQVISGIILSKNDKQPIPYAKIGIDKENFGVVADDKANFSIDLTGIDRSRDVKVDVAGYETFSENLNDFIKRNNHEILLTEKVKDIKEVTITPKTLIDKTWGVKTKTKSVLFVVNPETSKEIYNLETALQFSTKKRAKIKTINLNIASLAADQPIVLRYSIYSEKNGLPDQNILDEEITAELTEDAIKDGTFTIDINDKNIWVQGKFFVAIHFLNQFKGELQISAALLKTGYIREFYGDWQKVIIAAPAINIEVKVDKNGKNDDSADDQ